MKQAKLGRKIDREVFKITSLHELTQFMIKAYPILFVKRLMCKLVICFLPQFSISTSHASTLICSSLPNSVKNLGLVLPFDQITTCVNLEFKP